MCVFLCANPNMYMWLDAILARSQRQSLPLFALCPPDPHESTGQENDEVESLAELSVGRGRVFQSRERWALMIDRRLEFRPASAYEWHKPLDALANAWSRLLILVGWRR
jgi:hypothetical protein